MLAPPTRITNSTRLMLTVSVRGWLLSLPQCSFPISFIFKVNLKSLLASPPPPMLVSYYILIEN